MHPVDPITIACKSDPVLLKDVKDTWLRDISDGWYGGQSIRETLLKDEFEELIGGRIRKGPLGVEHYQ